MKKIILIILCIFSIKNNLNAKENLVYYHMATKTAPGIDVTEFMIDYYKKNDLKIDFKFGMSCLVKSQVNNEKNPMIVEFASGRYWQSLQEKDKLCDIDLSKFKYLGVKSLWYNVAVPTNSSFMTFDDLVKAKSIGYSAGSGVPVIIKEINKKYKINIKAVEFTNSTEAAKAILAGDVELGILAEPVTTKMEKNKLMRTIAFGNPNEKNNIFSNLPDMIKNVGLVGNFMIFAVKNVDDELYEKLISITLQAKNELDIFIPNNKLITVKSKDDREIIQFINDSIFGLYDLTKN